MCYVIIIPLTLALPCALNIGLRSGTDYRAKVKFPNQTTLIRTCALSCMVILPTAVKTTRELRSQRDVQVPNQYQRRCRCRCQGVCPNRSSQLMWIRSRCWVTTMNDNSDPVGFALPSPQSIAFIRLVLRLIQGFKLLTGRSSD